jgi:hypothetical protein
VRASGSLEAGPMEAVHAGEDVELLAEQSFEALLALVTGIDFDASVFDHSQLVFQLLSIRGIAVH